MPLAKVLPGRLRSSRRLPGSLEDLRGPARGVILLPRNLAWPGLRECDVTDERTRRGCYSRLLARGTRNDIARLVNGALLRRDWPLIRDTVEASLRRQCERRFALDAAEVDSRAADAAIGADPVPSAGPLSAAP
jgi:hypothetical protein